MNKQFFNSYEMQPIVNESVVNKIINKIQEALVYGKFKLGDKLPSEFELMEQLNVGRNSLREAVKVLTTLGILEVKRGDGTYICKELTPSYANHAIYHIILQESSSTEITEFRKMLDEDVLSMAVIKCTSEDILKLKEIINEMRISFNEGDVVKAAKLDYSFHMFLTECCKNKFLQRIVHETYSIFEGSIEQNIRSEEQFALADNHHMAMVDCIEKRALSQVSSVIDQSLSSWNENVKKE